jgi:hypothetical protein
MQFGNLNADVLSVEEVLNKNGIDGRIAAVHGVLYRGKGCLEQEFLLLPKFELFDGLDIGEVRINKHRVLAIEPDISTHLVGTPSGSGLWTTKIDAIIVGRINKSRFLEYGAFLSDIWIMILQYVSPLNETTNFRKISVINFSQDPISPMPDEGIRYEVTNLASVDLMPFPKKTNQTE